MICGAVDPVGFGGEWQRVRLRPLPPAPTEPSPGRPSLAYPVLSVTQGRDPTPRSRVTLRRLIQIAGGHRTPSLSLATDDPSSAPAAPASPRTEPDEPVRVSTLLDRRLGT